MRLILWVILFIGVYVWLSTSGNDQVVLREGKKIYSSVVSWFDDAEFEFHFKKGSPKKKTRRWD
jgi:hypothetical protein